MRDLLRRLGILVCSVLFSIGSFGQSANLSDTPPAAATVTSATDTGATPAAAGAISTPTVTRSTAPAQNFGAGLKVSMLGVGIEAAARVTTRSNVRAGFNILGFSRGFDKDGVSYDGHLAFRTIEAHYDFFPFAGGFHVSPGALFYLGNPIKATASVSSGQSFSLGSTTYYSDTAVPITGTGKIDFNSAAPMVTVGWGNLIPRKESKHWSMPVELGIAFQGAPKATLNLAGNACDSPGVNCRPVATDSTIQANIQSEQTKINNSMSFFKVYPIISSGISYKF